uniref:Ovule protein n=1 Tax=Brugia timori TaxID=42155 RepID=A0A0R3QY47_9BILA
LYSMQRCVLYDANSAVPSYSCTLLYCSTRSLVHHGTKRHDHPSSTDNQQISQTNHLA